jgi:hypothetical protein
MQNLLQRGCGVNFGGIKIDILKRAETLPKRIHKADPQMQNLLQRGVVIFCLAPHIVRGMN